MLYTKKQAPGVWCPWGFRPVDVQFEVREGEDPVSFVVAANRGPNGEALCPCIADRCPMWKWVDPPALGENRRAQCGRKTEPGAVINAQPQGGGLTIPHLKRN